MRMSPSYGGKITDETVKSDSFNKRYANDTVFLFKEWDRPFSLSTLSLQQRQNHSNALILKLELIVIIST